MKKQKFTKEFCETLKDNSGGKKNGNEYTFAEKGAK